MLGVDGVWVWKFIWKHHLFVWEHILVVELLVVMDVHPIVVGFVTPQFPDLKISLNKNIYQSNIIKECHISQQQNL